MAVAGIIAVEDDIAHRLVQALGDVVRLTTEAAPDLDQAAFIDDWIVHRDRGASLIGRVWNHPTIADGHLVHTSDLIAINVDAGWARTLNRVYRLGSPLAVPRH